MPEKVLLIGAASMSIEKCPCCGESPHKGTISYFRPACHPEVGLIVCFVQELHGMYLLCRQCRRAVLAVPVEPADRSVELGRICLRCRLPLPVPSEELKALLPDFVVLPCGHAACDECAVLPGVIMLHALSECAALSSRRPMGRDS